MMRLLTPKSLMQGFFSTVLLCFLAVAQAAETGLLWKIESPGGPTSHVFGTIHVDDERVTDFSPTLLQALEHSEIFMMETLPPTDASLYLMPNHNLREALTEGEWGKVRELADLHAMHDDVVLRMKPWMLAMVFDLPASQGPYTQDIRLYARAQQAGKQIEGLENAREHFTLLDNLSRDEQLTILRAALKRSPEEKEHDFEELLNAYLQGDVAVIAQVDEKTTSNSLLPALWQKMRVKLLDERNATMAERIIDKADEKSLFVAVGAAHLAGKGGILARLRQAGYRVSVVR